MDVHASLRFLRMSPRKVRLVINTVRGLSVRAAETRLSFLEKGASEPVLKLLRSAMANAEHNFHLDKESLFVKSITADGGPTIKRSRPRAFGRSAVIRKRTTHIMLVLGSKDGSAPAASAAKAESGVESAPAPAAPKKRAPAAKKTTAPKKAAAKPASEA